MAENKFEETKDTLLEFISKNSDEIKGICIYLECLIELKQFEEVETVSYTHLTLPTSDLV